MGRNTLILTVGLPRSGKSTWARQQGIPVVNPDAIRLAMHGQRVAFRAEPWVWVMARTMVRSLFLAGHSRVILDATNVTERRRREWRDRDWDLEYHVVDTPVEECIARAVAGGMEELVPVIERMAVRLELPEELDQRPGPSS